MIEGRLDCADRRLEWTFAVAALALAAVQCWRYRHFMYPDGVQYVDVARRLVVDGPSGLLNGTWSPLYPALLAGVWRMRPASAQWLYPSVQTLNFLCYAVTIAAFLRFVRSAAALRASRGTGDAGLSPNAFAACAFVTFLITIGFILNVRTMSPDMLVAASIFLVSALLLDARRGQRSYWLWPLVGVALGVGYLAKAVMFPVAFLYLGVGCLAEWRRDVRGPLIATIVFGLVALPWLIALSAWKMHPTYGDTGPLMYAWWVNGWANNLHWSGMPAGSGTPLHAVTQLFAAPDAFGFDRGAPVTYPLFFDPTWWNEGVTPALRFADQLRALQRTAEELSAVVFGPWLGIVVVGGLLAGAADARRSLREFWASAPVWLPALGAVALYMLVHVEGRLIAGQLQVLATALFAALVFPRERAARLGPIAASALLAAFLVTGGPVAAGSVRRAWLNLSARESVEAWPDWEVAQGLHRAGLRPGDRVAVIGNTLDVAWAQIADLTIRAEISADQLPSFLAAGAATRDQVVAALRAVPVRAVVARSPSQVFNGPPWSRIAGTEFAVTLTP